MQFQWREGWTGLLLGAGFGALAGLSVCTWCFESDLLLFGAAILVSAAVCGVAGFLWGESFIEWLKDSWHWW